MLSLLFQLLGLFTAKENISQLNIFPTVLDDRSEWRSEGMPGRTEEQQLLYHLLEGYERSVRPVRNASDPVVVRVGILLTNIIGMRLSVVQDEKNQVLSTNVWLEQEWKDEFLQWDPSQFYGIESIRIPCEYIWLPDIVLYNNADDYAVGYMQVRAMVHHDGTIFWAPPTQLRSTCKIDIAYFPFDSQRCSMKFGSWAYHGFELDLWNRSDNVDLSNYVPSGEFELVQVHQNRRDIKYPCCEERYPYVTFFIHVRRKTLYYMLTVVFPCMLLSGLALFVFLLSPDSGEKIALGITALLSFCVFVLTMAEKMPETSESMPLIGVYFTSVMSITSTSIVMTVMVLNFHDCGPRHRPLPYWIRSLILGKLRRSLGMKLKLDQIDRPHRTTKQQKSLSSRQYANALRHVSLCIMLQSIKNNAENEHEDSATDSCEFSKLRSKSLSPDEVESSQRDQEMTLEALNVLLARQKADDEWRTISNEWRQVAEVIDRFLFWIFFAVTLTVTIGLLVVIPVVDRLLQTTKFDEKLFAVLASDSG